MTYSKNKLPKRRIYIIICIFLISFAFAELISSSVSQVASDYLTASFTNNLTSGESCGCNPQDNDEYSVCSDWMTHQGTPRFQANDKSLMAMHSTSTTRAGWSWNGSSDILCVGWVGIGDGDAIKFDYAGNTFFQYKTTGDCPVANNFCIYDGTWEDTGIPVSSDLNITVCYHYNSSGGTIWTRNSTGDVKQYSGADFGNLSAKNVGPSISSGEGMFWDFIYESQTYDADWDWNELGIVTGGAGPNAPSDPIWTAPTPADNSHNNTNVTFNATHSGTDVKYFVYMNNYTYYVNSTESGTGHYSWDTNLSDGVYTYKVSVQNITNGLFSNNISRLLYIDTVSPTITPLADNWQTDNLTIISPHIANLTLNISFADETDLYQTLINLTYDENGTSYYNRHNISITTLHDNFSTIVDIGNFPLGNYTLKLLATDSHTAHKIEKYNTLTGWNYIRYKTPEGNVIWIESDSLPISKKTTRLRDRYNFRFNYLFSKSKFKYTIRSLNKIKYLTDSAYDAHFVIMGNSEEGNWIDFNNPKLTSKDYNIKKIDDYTYEVEINSCGLKSLEFSSIGGLNKKEDHYRLRMGAVVDIYSFDDENGTALPVTVTSGSQTAHGTPTSPATLYNITKKITSVTINSTGYGTEIETVTINQSYHNFTLNMTPVNSIKIYFYDEKSETLIKNETFETYLESISFSKTYSGITTNPYTITGLDSGIYEMKASSTNYEERQYFNINISNTTTTTINIYLANSTYGGEKRFSVTDSSMNPLEDVYILFKRIINGTKTVVAEEYTDYAGQCKLYLDKDYEYEINFSKGGYDSKVINLEPIDNEYSIVLISSVTDLTNISEGIYYRFFPRNLLLNNNTNYNFTFILNSTGRPVTGCTLTIKNGSQVIGQDSGYNPNSCYLEVLNLNTGNATNLTSEANYELSSQYNTTIIKQYKVIYTYEGEFSLKNFFDDLSEFGMAGFDTFGRMMLALVVIFILTAIISKYIGFNNAESSISLIWALTGFFSYINWFYLDYEPIPDILNLRKYIIFILVSLIVLGFLIDKYAR